MNGDGIFIICLSLALLAGSIWGTHCVLLWCNTKWKILPEGFATIASVFIIALVFILLAVFLARQAASPPVATDGPYVTVFEMSLLTNAFFIKVFCILAFFITVFVGLFRGFLKEYREPTHKQISKEQTILVMILSILTGLVAVIVLFCLFGITLMDDVAALRQLRAGQCFVVEGEARCKHIRTERTPRDIVNVNNVKFEIISGAWGLSFSPRMSLGNTKGNIITEGMPVRIHYYQSITTSEGNKIAKIEVKTTAASNGLNPADGSWESQKKKLAIPDDSKSPAPQSTNEMNAVGQS